MCKRVMIKITLLNFSHKKYSDVERRCISIYRVYLVQNYDSSNKSSGFSMSSLIVFKNPTASLPSMILWS